MFRAIVWRNQSSSKSLMTEYNPFTYLPFLFYLFSSFLPATSTFFQSFSLSTVFSGLILFPFLFIKYSPSWQLWSHPPKNMHTNPFVVVNSVKFVQAWCIYKADWWRHLPHEDWPCNIDCTSYPHPSSRLPRLKNSLWFDINRLESGLFCAFYI